MSFAYNPPRRRIVVDLGDAEDVDGLFDTISDVVGKVTGAASTVTNAISKGAQVVDAVGSQAKRVQSAIAPPHRAPSPPARYAPRPATRGAVRLPPGPRPMPVASRLQSFEMPAETAEAAPRSALPIAIGAAVVLAAGGGAWWLLGRKEPRRGHHR